ncbi:DUF1919 domain-containing protein [Sporocytophaga myxococcoides]|uniref:DUF1919 domain-containing protein n=1 Tax=Sporocytophaga myxococcoides TaxID=153721 RepID=UPI000418A90F|nr:DUF1919 domain-containing protein [Sporocytophaga myxococcoides]
MTLSKKYPIKFSVAMTTYNHEKYLAHTLDTIFAQIHDYSFEIVISDDCSTDKTQEIIKEYHQRYPDNIVPILHKKNIGVSKNCLHNLRSCRGEYIVTLDGDDYFTEPNKLKWQIEFLDNNPDFVISCHRFQRFYEDTGRYDIDFYPELFINNPDGFEFGQEKFFDQWLTQTLTVVFRSSALDNTPQLETFKYCWDLTIFWTVMTKGRAYIHNFFGAVYRIHSEGHWSQKNIDKKYTQNYLIFDELLKFDPDNIHIKRIFEIHQNNLLWRETENRKPLDLTKINNKNFTIISDDNWGAEVYNALGIPYQTPFVGIIIYNKDFIKLASDFEYYLNQSIRFVPISQSKYVKGFQENFGRPYPLGILGESIELHFVDYTSEEEAFTKWNERKSKINYDRLFFKMDGTRETDNVEDIKQFISLDITNKVCFLGFYQQGKVKNDPIKDELVIMENWSPVSEIFFPCSLNYFNVIDWINGGKGYYTELKPYTDNIFKTITGRSEFFLTFDEKAESTIDALTYPEAYQLSIDQETESVKINYNKKESEFFHIPAQLTDQELNESLFLDLSFPEDRHVFILTRGSNGTKLGLNLGARGENNLYDFIFETEGIEQPLNDDYQWIHFDFSIFKVDIPTEQMFSRIKSFYLYANPKEEASGEIEIMALFSGSKEKFQEMLN